MNEQTRSILARLNAAEARLAVLESAEDEGCCGGSDSRQIEAVAVAEPTRMTIAEGVSLCAQVMEVPAASEGKSANPFYKHWLEDDHGKVLGEITCVCFCEDGNELSTTCRDGKGRCDCERCHLSCW